MDFCADGAALFKAAISGPLLPELRALSVSRAGLRIRIADVLSLLPAATAIAAGLLDGDARPVRAVLFDKTAEDNWALGWHQDRTIAVRARADVPGFGPWTVKQGILHVAPPMNILERMATLRLHIDDCDAGNAPLRIACGSHRLGHVPAGEAAASADALPQHICVAAAGDVWAYATSILHASDRAVTPSRRRVLQVDYATFDLPGGLDWLS